jgi:hypothetical protein
VWIVNCIASLRYLSVKDKLKLGETYIFFLKKKNRKEKGKGSHARSTLFLFLSHIAPHPVFHFLVSHSLSLAPHRTAPPSLHRRLSPTRRHNPPYHTVRDCLCCTLFSGINHKPLSSQICVESCCCCLCEWKPLSLLYLYSVVIYLIMWKIVNLVMNIILILLLGWVRMLLLEVRFVVCVNLLL